MDIITNIDRLAQMSADKLTSILREQAREISQTQQQTLLNILDRSKDSEFGRKHGFSQITSYKEYRETVPVGEYADFKPYIDRMYDGEADVLFCEPVVSFVFTSGTTGDAKMFPESKSGNTVKSLISSMRSRELARMLKGRRTENCKIFTITNTSNFGKNKAGVPTGSASGLALAQAGRVSEKLAVPIEFSRLGKLSTDVQNYCFAFYALSEKRVEELVCNNLAHFVNVFDIINNMAEKLLYDIELGTLSVKMDEDDKRVLLQKIKPAPSRAEELRKIYTANGRLDVVDFWPNFCCVGCWLSSSVGRIAKEYKGLFPQDTIFIHWGYGASESKVDVPVDVDSPNGIPVLFGTFYEFRDVSSGEIFLADQIKENKLYELIITSYSGLYRYALHDLVKLYKGKDGLLRIEFISKSKDKITVDDKVLYAGELTNMVEKYEKQYSSAIRLFQGKKCGEGIALYVEPINVLDFDSFSEFMKKELASKGIEYVSVNEYPQGYRNSLYSKVIDGKSVSSTKIPVFID